MKYPLSNTSVLLDLLFAFAALLLDAPPVDLEHGLVGPFGGFATPLPVEGDLVGETDFILETGFVVAFLGVFEEGTAFFGGIVTLTSQILADIYIKLSSILALTISVIFGTTLQFIRFSGESEIRRK